MLPQPPRPTLFPYTTLFRSFRIVNASYYTYLQQVAHNLLVNHYRKASLGTLSLFDEEAERVSGKKEEPEESLDRSEEHTSELQSQFHLVCRLLLEKKNKSEI